MTITDNDVVGFQELIPFDDATLLNGVFETLRMATPRRIISLVARLREAGRPFVRSLTTSATRRTNDILNRMNYRLKRIQKGHLSLVPQFAVEGTIADRFGDVAVVDVLGGGEVCDRSRDAQYAIVGAGG